MKVLLTYGENTQDVINYAELDSVKTRLDNQPVLPNKQLYHDVENATQANTYIIVSMENALENAAFKEYKSYNTINIYDEILDIYYTGTILRTVYVNNEVCRIEFYILPIQTNYLNGISRNYDCLMVKTPNKPTYSNNIAQSIVGETVTSVNYTSAITAALKDFQIVPKIMLVVNKDLSPLGIANKGFGAVIPSGEIVLDNPLPACATKIGGSTVPGFVQFFDNQDGLQRFIESCYNADIKVNAPIFGNDGSTYQAPKTPYPVWAGGSYIPIAKQEDLNQAALAKGAAVMDASRIDSVYVPESITPASFIICKEIPFQLCASEESVTVGVNLPIVVNAEPYFNLSSLLQVKCIASTGQSMTLDGNNILFNDGNPATGFNCRMVASLSGIDLYIGESSYVLNLCKFPEVSYSGNSFENYNTINTRTGILSKISTTATNYLGTAVDKIYNGVMSGFETTAGANSKNYENIGLDKTSVIGSINATAWTTATFHIETTYLPSGVKNRLNAVYGRFGYDDYLFKNIDVNAIPAGYWQAGQIQEVNTNGLTKITYINNEQSDGIKGQLARGVYVK